MADKIGLKRSWFQKSKQEMPHYDLVASKRKLAVKSGAIELTRNEAAERIGKYLGI